MNRRIPCCLLAGLMLCGCGAKNKAEMPVSQAQPEVVTLSAAPSEQEAGEGTHYGVYSLDGGELTEEFGTYDSDTADENALLACDGAVFTVRDADINKTGDAASSLFSGLNAAAAAVAGAQMTLENCVLTTNGAGATGLFCAGEGTLLNVSNAQAVTAGANSPALVAADGAAAIIAGTRLMSEATDASLILTRGNAAVTLSGCTLQFAGAQAVEAHGGLLSLTLDGQQLAGDIRLTALNDEMPAALALTLKNGASFTGAILAGSMDEISVTLDGSSAWTLTGDLTLSALTAPDTSFSGIQSNGFSVFYNAEHEANAWLNSQAYALPGGGYLTPMI